MEEKKLTDEEIVTEKSKEWARRDKYCIRIQKAIQYKGNCDHEDIPSILVEYEEIIKAEQKAEIERLTEENAILKGNPPMTVGRSNGKIIRAKLLAFDKMKEQNDELQKQVDELTEEVEKAYEIERANIQAEIADCGVSCHWCRDLTVKDTAKEIIDELNSIKPTVRATYGVQEQVGVDIAINRVKNYFKQKGVEIE